MLKRVMGSGISGSESTTARKASLKLVDEQAQKSMAVILGSANRAFKTKLIINVLLGQELTEVGDKLETLEKRSGGQVLSLCSLSCGHASPSWIEVRKVQTAHNRTQSRILRDVSQELAEDSRVRNGNLVIERR
jgi:hypothetical protein